MKNNKQYEELTNEVIKALDKGKLIWRQPFENWVLPLRENGVPYEGINRLVLACVKNESCFDNPHWLTYNQAKKLGGNVIKGEKSTGVFFFKLTRFKNEDDSGEVEEKTVPLLKSYRVFNASQVEGLDDRFVVEKNNNPLFEKPELFVQKIDHELKTRDAQPAFFPVGNYISMPDINSFHTSNDYYATYMHELIHWTGHKSRLDRDMGNVFGSQKYAFEELVAEFGSLFLSGHLGVESKLDNNHVAYIQSWARGLREDPRALIRASSLAQDACDYLINEFENSSK